MLEDMCGWKNSPCIFWPRRDVMTGGHLYCWFPVSDQLNHTGTAWLEVTHSFRFSGSLGEFFRGRMAVIAGTESLEAPLDHPREQGEDRTNLIINYLPQVSSWRFQYNTVVNTLTLIYPFCRQWPTMSFTPCSSQSARSSLPRSWGTRVPVTATATVLFIISNLRTLPRQLPHSMDFRFFSHKDFSSCSWYWPQVSNKRIKVSYSRPNTADIKDTNLYVGNVPQVLCKYLGI